MCTTSALADVVISDKAKQLATKNKIAAQQAQQCLDLFHQDDGIKACLKQAKNEEFIQVQGRYIGMKVPEIEGRFHLNKDFIDNTPRSTGDINDLIGLLPGVQLSEDALNVENAGEIRGLQISIAGAQPWQTGFYMDGMNYNSRQDPNAYNLDMNDRNLDDINDVTGAPQTFNVNSRIVQSIDVFTSNIPVEYGEFSGGVVSVETLNIFDNNQPRFATAYRTSRSAWNQYHVLKNLNQDTTDTNEGSSENESNSVVPPEFTKQGYDIMLRLPLNEHHGLLLAANHTTSDISKLSLSEMVPTYRESTSLLLKYSMRDLGINELDLSVNYSPYQSDEILTDVKDGNYSVDGGGYGATLRLKHDFELFNLNTTLSYSHSDNSRSAPQHYYMWLTAKGKEWGQLASSTYKAGENEDDKTVNVSLQGGFGDLDKTQSTINWKTKFSFNGFTLGNSYHQIYTGFELNREDLQRVRPYDSYYYNSAKQYSTSLDSTPLNCSGYTNDCVEISYVTPLADLIESLGGSIDFTNLEQAQAYADNIATTPQYFSTRKVYSAEDIQVSLNKAGTYINDFIEWKAITLNLGLRYDYDDFFKNHNIAPRISGGYDWFDNGRSLFTFGASRYYDAGLTTYRIREQQIPYYTQYRTIKDSYLQGWIKSSTNSDSRYRYENVATPFNDEISLGWKQHTDSFGTFSIDWQKRWQKDQLAQAGDPILESDGFEYIYQDNSGKGHSQYLSLSWNAQWQNHSFWANTSFSETYTSSNSYDEDADTADSEDLAYYEGEITTVAALTRMNTNFGRPLIVNFGWSTYWTDSLSTSVSGSYKGGYSAAESTGNYYTASLTESACDDCETTKVQVLKYERVDYDPLLLLNLSAKYRIDTRNWGDLLIRTDIQNLFNSRTHTVRSVNSGVEIGRTLWLSMEYQY